MRKALLFVIQAFFFSGLLAQNQSDDPVIALQAGSLKVTDLFEEITRQSGYNFSYNAKLIDDSAEIEFDEDRLPLGEVLKVLERRLEISVTVIDRQIVLNRSAVSGSTDDGIENFSISGYLADAATGEILPGATVSVQGTSLGVVTNGFGYYSLTLEEGKHNLIFSYISFEEKSVTIELQKNINLDISLESGPIELPNVIVALANQIHTEEKDPSHVSLNPATLQNLPEFGGESGLIKGLQTLPGIKSHSDGSAFFYTRGGDRDQNVIFIDDAPIFNPAHLFGFYSIVIPEFTKEIKVYKSDIPAYLGDRLSSIVNIRTKDGNLNNWQFSGSLNPLVNRLSVEFPVVRGNSSIFTSVRRSNFEWLYKKSNPDADLSFGDFNFKWNYRLGASDRLFFTLITARDGLLNQVDDSGISWGNLASTIRWNHIFGKKLFSNTTLYTGSYRYRLRFDRNAWESAIGTLSLKTDFTLYSSPSITSHFGFEFAGFGFNPGTISTENTLVTLPDIRKGATRKRILYYQLDAKLSPKIHASVGVRASSWQNLGPAQVFSFDTNYQVNERLLFPAGAYQAYFYPDPRLALKFFLSTRAHLKFAFGQYHQYIQLISNSVSPFTSFEVWLPSSKNLKPQQVRQVDLSFLKDFSQSGLELSMAAYYKFFDNQIDYEPHANTIINPLLEGELRSGTMRAYGLEIQLKKEFGRINGWLNYTYSRALRKTPAIANGAVYPAFQDRPHDFSLLVNYQLSRRFFLSSYLTAYTGSAFSSPTGFYHFLNQTVPIYDRKNNDRLPAYQRLDFALQFQLNKNSNSRFQHSLNLSFYNILKHKNIVAVNFNKISNDPERPTVPINFIEERDLISTQADLIRFLPSLTYKFRI